MKKIFRLAVYPAILLICLFLNSCSSSSVPGGNPDVLVVTDGNFKHEVLESDLPVLVDFWATWCGPCRMYGPIVDKVAGEYKGRLKVVRVDVDQNPNLSKDFHIQAIPASFILEKGTIAKNWVGLESEDDVRQQVDQVLSIIPATGTHP